MTLTVVAVCLCAAAAAAGIPGEGQRARAAAISRPHRDGSKTSAPAPPSGRHAAVSVLTGLGVWVVVGGVTGVVSGVLGAVGTRHLLRRTEPPSVRARRRRLAADMPITADLLAACLSAGATPPLAASAVGRSVGGPMAESLRRVVVMLELGAAPPEAWAQLGEDIVLRPLARAFVRASECGTPLAAVAALLADDVRSAARARAEVEARRVGVLVAAPLGLCFLPAFALLGVVPVVLGIASSLAGPVVP